MRTCCDMYMCVGIIESTSVCTCISSCCMYIYITYVYIASMRMYSVTTYIVCTLYSQVHNPCVHILHTEYVHTPKYTPPIHILRMYTPPIHILRMYTHTHTHKHMHLHTHTYSCCWCNSCCGEELSVRD
eukprot:GHVQ01040588.1.p1 GENE.GHVQ01040588.1~~GHVQ01040588.1.p1  ORF type:complete len:129 (-),score=11.11 GHVQ01040588.1:75-461(-)